jgi:hypothetical protein
VDPGIMNGVGEFAIDFGFQRVGSNSKNAKLKKISLLYKHF